MKNQILLFWLLAYLIGISESRNQKTQLFSQDTKVHTTALAVNQMRNLSRLPLENTHEQLFNTFNEKSFLDTFMTMNQKNTPKEMRNLSNILFNLPEKDIKSIKLPTLKLLLEK